MKNNFKGTKGDWFTSGDGKYRMSVDSKNFGIKTVCTVNTLISAEETKANALLISKAPEMLEMLKSIIASEHLKGTIEESKVKQLIKSATSTGG